MAVLLTGMSGCLDMDRFNDCYSGWMLLDKFPNGGSKLSAGKGVCVVDLEGGGCYALW